MLKRTGIGLGAAGFFAGAMKSPAQKAPAKRPNIIYLMTDDQRWDALGCMGNPIVQTPNIDAMAASSTVFNNMFVTTSICCSSRACVFTGQYVSRNGIDGFGKPITGKQLQETYPMQLKQAGYRIGFIGKYGVGNSQFPIDQYDYWKGFPGQGHYFNHDNKPKHLTEVMGDQSLEFLDGCSADEPFCLSVSFKAAHCQDGDPRQFLYDPKYEDLYKDVEIPRPETAGDEYWKAFPEAFRKNPKTGRLNEARRRWEIRFSTDEKFQKMVKGYYRLVTGVDDAVGRIRRKLAEKGFDDNTIIIFTSDNGFYLGEHGLAGKWYGHEESIRVPLIIYDPRLPKDDRAQRRNEMALNIDMAPTMLSYAGLTPPEAMQGRNLKPIVDGQHLPWRHDFYYEHFVLRDLIPGSEGVVGDRLKYMRYFWEDGKTFYEELYDRKDDPHEKRNLIDEPGWQYELKRMKERLNRLRRLAK